MAALRLVRHAGNETADISTADTRSREQLRLREAPHKRRDHRAPQAGKAGRSNKSDQADAAVRQKQTQGRPLFWSVKPSGNRGATSRFLFAPCRRRGFFT